MKTTKLLTILVAFVLFPQIANSQCDLITVNGSTQMPDGVCSPVTFGMEAHYEFLVPVDPSLVEILYRWNDAANTETLVSGNWNASNDSVWATATHVYPPDDQCSKTAEAILVYDGQVCESSAYQSQTFATWGTDEENSGQLNIDPVVHYVCEGVDVIDFVFSDNSEFNCNIGIESDRPNRLDRWVQFTYNTYSQAGDRIPNVTVRDNGGTVHNMTNAGGGFISNLDGEIVRIPYPADGPTEISYAITAPAGGVAGDIFEITLRNWNVCNPYDNTPNDGNPPADIINGDNPPIITTARIEIIAPTPVVVPSLFEYCTGDNIVLTASAGSSEIRWYKNASLDTLLHTGTNYNPTAWPMNVDADTAGNYSFYITTYQGICESAPTQVDLEIYQAPATAFAGNNQTICTDTTTLNANTATTGSGEWSTTSSSVITNPSNNITGITDLEFGSNHFTWTITHGPCSTSDVVTIYSDRQPDPADAGPNQTICDTDPVSLDAAVPTNMGLGIWNILKGSGTFSDSTQYDATISSLPHDTTELVWRVSSRYGVCPITSDSVQIVADYNPGIANAGIDISLCENSTAIISANEPINSGIGYWSIPTGTATITDPTLAINTVQALEYASNMLIWNLNSKLGICPANSDTLIVYRYQSPGSANAGPDKSFCLETQDTLIGNTPIIGTGIWNVIQNPSAIAPSFSPNNSASEPLFSVTPGNEGAYYLEWELTNGSCHSADTVIIDFGIPVPQANAGRDTVACGYDYEMHGNPIAIGMGTWTLLSGPGSVSFTPDVHTPNSITSFNPGSEGLYSFEWRFNSGSCPPTRDTVDIEITIAPLPPNLSDIQSCGPDSFNITIPSGNARNVAYWYESNSSPSHFYRGNQFNTKLISESDEYFIKLYDTISTCESNRVMMNIVIDSMPPQPILTNDTLCRPGSGTVRSTPVAPANLVAWYSEGNHTFLDSSSVITIDTLTTSQFFVSKAINSITGCESILDSTRIIVHNQIPAPTVSNDSSCGSASFTISASKSIPSNSLFWYNDSLQLIDIGDNFVSSVLDSSTHFFVAEYNPLTRCFSDLSPFELIIHAVPNIPLINDTTSCGASTFTLKPFNKTTDLKYNWYNHPIDNDLITTADSFTTELLANNASYWLSAQNKQTLCESDRAQVDISIFPNPTVIDILGPTMVLKEQSDVIFFTINGQPGSIYNWTIPNDIVVESYMNDFVRLAFPSTGNFTLSVFETTANGCVGDPVFHSITVIEDSILIDIGEFEQGACTADPFEIKPWLFGGAPPYVYQWTGDTEHLSSTNTLFTTFSPPGTGTFQLYLEVIDVNLRVSYDSVLITVNESPVTAIINRDLVACVGDNLMLTTISSGTEPYSHLWTGPIHRLNSYNIANPTYTPNSIDTADFHYMLTDANGCHAYDTISIVSDEPTAVFKVLTDPGCSPLLVEFENNSVNATSYTWDFGGLGNSIAFNPTHNFVNTTPEIQYIDVQLHVESSLGCTDSKSEYVMVWPNPTADITALPQNSCNPAHTLLVSNPGNRFYHWSFGDGTGDTTTGSFNHHHTFTNASTEDITYIASVITESSLNCSDTAEIAITVYATPQVDFTVAPEEIRFPYNQFQVENNTIGNWNYTWDFGDGTNDYNAQPEIHEYDEPGWYSINLQASGTHCSDSMTRRVHLLPALPVAEFKGADNGCMPHTVSLVNGSQYATSYLWDFGDGNISTAKDPSHTYYEPGIYKIKLKVSGEGGESLFSDTSRVYVLPNSYFDIAPRYVYVNDEPVHYFNLSDHADIIEWDFGDGNTSTEHNPKHIYKQEGTYEVTLKVWTDNGCFDLYVMENAVLVEPSGVVDFPNVFRPNSNIEENRVFKPGVIDHVDDYHLMIFNRWGELIYESFDQEIGWDGYYQGEIAKQDVYIWKVKGSYSDGKGFSKTGDVTLLY